MHSTQRPSCARSSLAVLLACTLWLALCEPLSATSLPDDTFSVNVVDLRPFADVSEYGALVLAAKASVGLANRALASAGQTPSYYTLETDDDVTWLDLLLPSSDYPRVSLDPYALLNVSYAQYGAVLFTNPAVDQVPEKFDALGMLPAVVTLCAVTPAVPIDSVLRSRFPGARVVFDARSAWKTPLEAVSFVADRFINQTSSLAFQGGADVLGGYLVDFLVKERIFVQYLNDSCIPDTVDHQLLQQIVDRSPWQRPVRVYGYNQDPKIFGGDLFEAETNCINVLGQVATEHSQNLGFWSGVRPLTNDSVLAQSPPGPAVQYDPNHTYIALVYGDMDNIDFVQTFGRQHMQLRASMCGTPNTTGTCFPLTWTMSPNLIHLAPEMLRWYYAQASLTGGRDWFIMPPSGTLYAYPGEMPSDVQQLFADQQNLQATIMNTTGSVHWEWVLTWKEAWTNYFPRFVNITHGTRAFFLNNVPWVFPILDMWFEEETYRIVGDLYRDEHVVVAFRPAFNWQEDGPSGGNPGNSTVIAEKINGLKKGSVQYVYVIQNTPMQSVFDMAAQLDPHVVLVGYENLVDLAIQRHKQRK